MKTSNLLKVSLGLLTTSIIIIGVMEALAKRDLKTCESRQSYRCPRFTCPGETTTCGHRPWICPQDQTSCSGNEICIGYCKNTENNCYD